MPKKNPISRALTALKTGKGFPKKSIRDAFWGLVPGSETIRGVYANALERRAAAAGSSSGRRERSSRRTVFAPTSITRDLTMAVPQMSQLGNGRVRVVHKEYVRDVTSSVNFVSAKQSINPGLVSMFPWLSRMASQYEQYTFNALAFEFMTSQSTGVPGTLQIAVDLDAADDAPVGKAQMFNYEGCVRSALWSGSTYRCSPQQLSTRHNLFVRTGALASNLDIKTYDFGSLVTATENGPSVQIRAGDLFVEYDITFSVPATDTVGQLTSGTELIYSTTGTTKDDIFGTAQTKYGNSDLATGTANILTFHVDGDYLVNIRNVGTGGTGTTVAIGGDTTITSDRYHRFSFYTDGTGGDMQIAVRVVRGEVLELDYSSNWSTITATRCMVIACPFASWLWT